MCSRSCRMIPAPSLQSCYCKVLGRGLRIPPGLTKEPLITISNHEAWSEEIGNLLKEVLEVENTLSWGYDPRRKEFVFPLHNLRYEPEQKTVETKREKAGEPDVKFLPQDRKTIEYSTFSETGQVIVEIEHKDLYEIEDAVKIIRLFLREKDEKVAAPWPKKRIHEFIVSKLKSAGQDSSFISKRNLLLLQRRVSGRCSVNWTKSTRGWANQRRKSSLSISPQYQDNLTLKAC